MLTLSKRPCQLGITINTRRELHGDEPVPACDIPILGITLDANELCSLLEEPTAHKALFDTKRGHDEPLFNQFEPFELKDKIEGASISLYIGLTRSIDLRDCKLKGLRLQPMAGGLTLLSFKIQTSAEDIGDVVGELVGHMDKTIDIEVADGERVQSKDSQQLDLPVNNFGDGEEPEQPAKGKRRRRNGQVTAH